MTSAAFISAILALLLAPGPTNTLMGIAGAQRGISGVLRLLPAELAGYLTAILPLVYLGAELLPQWPAAAIALKVVASIWVMFLAVSLWGGGSTANTCRDVTTKGVYLTTLLNPKALIFGLILLPPPADSQFGPRLGLFCLMVIAVALAWGTAGTLMRKTSGDSCLPRIQRLASIWLGVVSVTMIAGVIKG